MKIKYIIVAVIAIAIALFATNARAQDTGANNSPKEYYDALLIQQQNISGEISQCSNQMTLLKKRKAKKMADYIDNLHMQNVSIARQLEMFPKYFSDPQAIVELRKQQDLEFLRKLELKVQDIAHKQSHVNVENTADYTNDQFYSVLFAIADDNIPIQKYPQHNDVFVKEIANDKVAHFVGKFNHKKDAEELKNSILVNTNYKEAIVVLIK